MKTRALLITPRNAFPRPMERILFLSKDETLQVRAHLTRSGVLVFCIKDFIRQTARCRLGPEGAMAYWLYALGKLMHEDRILDHIPVLFDGPYERPTVCIDAEGLLILYHFLDEEVALVDEKYRCEVQEALMDVIRNAKESQHVRLHDDGEIKELLSEKGTMPRSMPPEGSRYVFGGMEKPVLEIAPREDQLEALRVENARLWEINREMARKLTEEEKRPKRTTKRGAFCIRNLIQEQGLDVPRGCLDQLCKTVISIFRQAHGRGFVRHRVTYFHAEDRECLSGILHDEYLKLRLKRGDEELQEEVAEQP